MKTSRRTFRPAAWLLLSILAAPLLGRAQAPDHAGAPGAAASAPAVTLAVTVLDKHGNLVPGLTAGDFTLQQDGRAQTIQSITPASAQPLAFGLLVQTSGGARRLISNERASGQTFAAHMLSESGNRAFVIQFSHEVDLLSDLSPQAKDFNTGLGQLGLPQSHNAPADADANSGSHHEGGGNNLYDAIYLASSEVLNQPTGRRVLIIFTDGVDRGSKESLFSAIEAAQRNNVSVYAVYFKDEQSEGRGHGFPGGLHRGTGYPGGSPGGYPGGYPGRYPGGYPGNGNPTPQGRPTQGSRIDGRKILEQICSETGGYMYQLGHGLNVDQAFAAVAQELNARYLVGYTPDSQDNYPGYHRVTLTTNKKGLTVQTRQGYYSGGA